MITLDFQAVSDLSLLQNVKMAQISLGTSLKVRFQTLISQQKLEKSRWT